MRHWRVISCRYRDCSCLRCKQIFSCSSGSVEDLCLWLFSLWLLDFTCFPPPLTPNHMCKFITGTLTVIINISVITWTHNAPVSCGPRSTHPSATWLIYMFYKQLLTVNLNPSRLKGPPPALEGPLAVNTRLQSGRRLFSGELHGPESFTADDDGEFCFPVVLIPLSSQA